MKKSLFAIAALSLATLCGCSKWAGDPITQEFSVDGSYTELRVEDAFDVTVSDAVSQVTITAGENIMPKVKVELSGKKLSIYLKGLTINYGDKMTVLLPYNPELTSVDLSGASNFHTNHAITGDEVSIDLSGASDFIGDIVAGEVEMELSGASSIKGVVNATRKMELELSGSSHAVLDGQTGKLELNISGSSDLVKKIVGDRYSFVCDQCECSISGSSDAYLHCDGSITGGISGSSELHYTGMASTSGCNVSGGSSVVHDVY